MHVVSFVHERFAGFFYDLRLVVYSASVLQHVGLEGVHFHIHPSAGPPLQWLSHLHPRNVPIEPAARHCESGAITPRDLP